MRRAGVLASVICVLALQAAPARAVVGGQAAAPGTFPYVADVLIGGAFGCTGTLIAPQWVLTAGHCGSLTGSLSDGALPTPIAWPASFYTVQLGSVYANGSGGETHSVSSVTVDTDYLVTNGTGNDVTLLELDKPSGITPMRVPATSERGSWAPGVLATIAGFGTTSENAGSAPSQMQFAKVPITTDAYCANAYPNGLSNTDGTFDAKTMICAGYPQGGTDTCQGDSGGPLLVPVAGGQLRLVGATSFGKGCAEAGKPGVYARLAEGPIRAFIERFVPDAFAAAGSSTQASQQESGGATPQSVKSKSQANSKRHKARKRHKKRRHHKKRHAHKHHAKKQRR